MTNGQHKLRLDMIKFHDTDGGSLKIASFKNSDIKLAYTSKNEQDLSELLELVNAEVQKLSLKKASYEPPRLNFKAMPGSNEEVKILNKALGCLELKSNLSSEQMEKEKTDLIWASPVPLQYANPQVEIKQESFKKTPLEESE